MPSTNDLAAVGEPLSSVLAAAVVAYWFILLVRDWRGGSPELRMIREMWDGSRRRDEELVDLLRQLVRNLRRS